ncbi:MAG: radical SAM family heme chaperone HemW [Candidatus Omnitrophica bacterium]|nr:radical SAM family heme chaperone HemW [Candidatus Omnitrophota bacterium]MBU1926116.1 radical SAM family heme chaperone HemW [Candidatus Omnitrophota bacterium]
MSPIGIYIHIPFCKQKCYYCNFNSIPLDSRKLLRSYIGVLMEDTRLSSQNFPKRVVKSVYFGGGTPSLLMAKEAALILQTIAKNFVFSANPEITLEANPATVSSSKAKAYRQAGINRVSLGAQSFCDKSLKILGRIHTVKDIFFTVSILHKAGFENVSIDLMYGLPGQSLSEWSNDLDKFTRLAVTHISFYDLKIERKTPFYRMRKRLNLADDDLQVKMYRLGCNKLEKAGYRHYEISSFAKDGFESMHNKIYWENTGYLGLGAGAYSYLGGFRFAKSRNIKKYISEVKKGKLGRYDAERISGKARIKENIALRLRILKPFLLKDVMPLFDTGWEGAFRARLENLRTQGFLRRVKDKYCLSKRGVLFYDTVAASMLYD